MKVTPQQQATQQQVDELLTRYGLAASEKNSGFKCFFGSGAEKPDSVNESLRVELAAHRRVYHIVDSASLAPFFWVDATVNSEGSLSPWVTRILLVKNQPDSQRVRASAAWKKLGIPTLLENMEPVLEKLAQTLNWRLKKLDVSETLDNRISLANIYFAYSANRLMNREQVDLSMGPIDWMRAGVAIEHILYAWSTDGWDYTRARPALPLAEAVQLKGIPLHRVRALYPQVTGRS